MQLQWAQIKDGKFEYYFGPKENADTIVFVHGLGANLTQFKKQCDHFGDRFQILAPNIIGHGASQSTRPFDLASCAQDIIDLLNALNIDKIH